MQKVTDDLLREHFLIHEMEFSDIHKKNIIVPAGRPLSAGGFSSVFL